MSRKSYTTYWPDGTCRRMWNCSSAFNLTVVTERSLFNAAGIAMHSLYAKITFASTALFPDVYFVSYNNCVFIVSSVAILGYNICVCHLLSNKEISSFTYTKQRQCFGSVGRLIHGCYRNSRVTCIDWDRAFQADGTALMNVDIVACTALISSLQSCTLQGMNVRVLPRDAYATRVHSAVYAVARWLSVYRCSVETAE